MRTSPGVDRPLRRQLAALLLVVPLLTALTWASLASVSQLRVSPSVGYEVALGAGATGLSWLLVLWLAGCLAMSLLARLPGLVGRGAGRLARLVTPRLVRRLLEAGLGTALLVGGSTAPVDAGATEPPLHAANGAAVGGGPDALPRPDRPTTKPRRPEPDDAQVVVVRAGDTLWSIAGTALPGRPSAAEIAASWPRWYAANRAVIGPDPDLVHPGDRLRPPRP